MKPQQIFASWVTVRAFSASPQSKCAKRTFILPQKYHVSVSNVIKATEMFHGKQKLT